VTTNKTLHLKKGNYGKASHHIKDCRIRLQEEIAKSSHQANSVLNTKLFTVALALKTYRVTSGTSIPVQLNK
jgi:hypothetical protein